MGISQVATNARISMISNALKQMARRIFHYLLSLDNDVLETSKRRAMFYNILSQNFIVKFSKRINNLVKIKKIIT